MKWSRNMNKTLVFTPPRTVVVEVGKVYDAGITGLSDKSE